MIYQLIVTAKPTNLFLSKDLRSDKMILTFVIIAGCYNIQNNWFNSEPCWGVNEVAYIDPSEMLLFSFYLDPVLRVRSQE